MSPGTVVGAVLGAVLVAGGLAPAPVTEQPVDQERLFRWEDPRIAESSGLVDRGGTMVTTNDSGHSSVLYVVDRSGRTVRTIDYGRPVRDVEALAPAGPRHVWVGDIGDNPRERETVGVHRVRVAPGPGPRTRSYRLDYPEGRSYDAESLLVDRRGRLVVITKGLTGGLVFRAPERLRTDRANRLRQVARVGELATDAALTRDGRHALVRGLAGMGVYELPGWRRVQSVDLPAQRQGEGVSVGRGDRVRVSSEGRRSWVWQLRLPPGQAAAPDPTPTPAPSPSSTTSPSSGEPPAPPDVASDVVAAERGQESVLGVGVDGSTMALVAGVIGIGAIGIGLALRRRGRGESS